MKDGLNVQAPSDRGTVLLTIAIPWRMDFKVGVQ